MSGTGLLVHVVDDDDAVRDSLEALLLVSGYDVATYESAEAFLAQQRPGRAGCILVDVQMPGISGLELLERLVAEGGAPPVLVLTASHEARIRDRALELGAHAFLSKPVTESALLEAIASADRGSHKENP